MAECEGADTWWHSLVWHYNRVEHLLGEIKLAQLVDVYVDTPIYLCLIATVEVVSEQIERVEEDQDVEDARDDGTKVGLEALATLVVHFHLVPKPVGF